MTAQVSSVLRDGRGLKPHDTTFGAMLKPFHYVSIALLLALLVVFVLFQFERRRTDECRIEREQERADAIRSAYIHAAQLRAVRDSARDFARDAGQHVDEADRQQRSYDIERRAIPTASDSTLAKIIKWEIQ